MSCSPVSWSYIIFSHHDNIMHHPQAAVSQICKYNEEMNRRFKTDYTQALHFLFTLVPAQCLQSHSYMFADHSRKSYAYMCFLVPCQQTSTFFVIMLESKLISVINTSLHTLSWTIVCVETRCTLMW